MREEPMKASHWIIAAAALAFVQPMLASAGVNDPEVIIYRFPGVRDDTTLANIATVFHCTNFSGVTENIRFVTRAASGNLQTNLASSINHLATRTASTHDSLPKSTASRFARIGVADRAAAALQRRTHTTSNPRPTARLEDAAHALPAAVDHVEIVPAARVVAVGIVGTAKPQRNLHSVTFITYSHAKRIEYWGAPEGAINRERAYEHD